MKGKIASIANYDKVNYVGIKKNKQTINIFQRFLRELGINANWFFEAPDYDIKTKKETLFDYDEHIDTHNLFGNKDFKIHTIFSKNYLHLIIITKNRDKLNKALRKYFDFVKSK